MGYRRSPDHVAAKRHWNDFVARSADLIARTGLPPLATASVADWDDFLMHGYLAGDPGGFTVEHLSSTQYSALVSLVGNYFREGYEWYSPTALSVDDQACLRFQFAPKA